MSVHPLIGTLSRLYDADRLLTRPAQLMAYESDALTGFSAEAGRRWLSRRIARRSSKRSVFAMSTTSRL